MPRLRSLCLFSRLFAWLAVLCITTATASAAETSNAPVERAEHRPRKPLVVPGSVSTTRTPSAEEISFAPSAARLAGKHSAFSAGEGGPLFIGIWAPIGGLLGFGIADGLRMPVESRFLPVLGGALAMGAIAAAYQYKVPLTVPSTLLSLWGAVAGFISGELALYALDAIAAPTDSPAAIAAWTIIGAMTAAGGWLAPALPGSDRITGPDALAIVFSTLWAETLVLDIWFIQKTPNPFPLGAVGIFAPAAVFAFGRSYLTNFDLTWADSLLGIGVPILASCAALLVAQPGGEFAAGLVGGLTLVGSTATVALLRVMLKAPLRRTTNAPSLDLIPTFIPVETGRDWTMAVGAAARF